MSLPHPHQKDCLTRRPAQLDVVEPPSSAPVEGQPTSLSNEYFTRSLESGDLRHDAKKSTDRLNLELTTTIRETMLKIMGIVSERPLVARLLLDQLDRRVNGGTAKSAENARVAAQTLRPQLQAVERAFRNGDSDKYVHHRNTLAQSVLALLSNKDVMEKSAHILEELERCLTSQREKNLVLQSKLRISDSSPVREESHWLRQLLKRPDVSGILLREEFGADKLTTPPRVRSDRDALQIFSILSCETMESFNCEVARIQALEDSLVAPLRTIVLLNQRLAQWQANKSKWKLSGFGGTLKLEVDDLVQVATLALTRAARRFDPTRAKFATYALNWIKQAIGRELDNAGALVRVPVYQRHSRAHQQQLEGPPSASSETHPIVHTDSDHPFGDALFGLANEPAAPTEDPSSPMCRDEVTARIRKLLNHLTATEAYIVQRWFGFDDRPEVTYKELATTFDRSRRWVHLTLQSALRKLQQVAPVMLKPEVTELMEGTVPQSTPKRRRLKSR